MNFVKIKTVNKSSLKESQHEQHNNEMYINLDQIISFEYDDLDIKNSKSEDQKYYQIILKYSKGAVLDFIVTKKYFYKIKTELEKKIHNLSYSAIEWRPNNLQAIGEEQSKKMIEVLSALEELDDVQNVFTNINLEY